MLVPSTCTRRNRVRTAATDTITAAAHAAPQAQLRGRTTSGPPSYLPDHSGAGDKVSDS